MKNIKIKQKYLKENQEQLVNNNLISLQKTYQKKK